MDFRDFFVKQKEAIRRRTRNVVGMLRPEHAEWRPVPGALSIGELLRHLWMSEQGVRHVALDADFTYYETRIPKGLKAVLGRPGLLDEEAARLESVHQATLTAVAEYPIERLEEEREHAALGFRRKVYVILLGINEHEIHHRAQLMTYLRILGTPVPEAIARR